MRVLVACEFSGIVSTAFRNLGHSVISCDLIESEVYGEHYKGSVEDILYKGYDLMIGHPPCTYLSYAGNKYFNVEMYGEMAERRELEKQKALEFFKLLWEAPIKHICLENPKGYAMRMIKQSQIINPFYFGDSERKGIYLWLKNLPPLYHSRSNTLFEKQSHVLPPEPVYTGKKKRYRTEALNGKSEDAKKERSRFFKGIAEAMALQWSEHIQSI